MRSTYYPRVCTTPGSYYQGWLVYMRYTQGQDEEYLLSRRVYYPGVCTIQEYVPTQVLTKQVPLHDFYISFFLVQ